MAVKSGFLGVNSDFSEENRKEGKENRGESIVDQMKKRNNKREMEKVRKVERERMARKEFRNWLEMFHSEVKAVRKRNGEKVREENVKYRVPEEICKS